MDDATRAELEQIRKCADDYLDNRVVSAQSARRVIRLIPRLLAIIDEQEREIADAANCYIAERERCVQKESELAQARRNAFDEAILALPKVPINEGDEFTDETTHQLEYQEKVITTLEAARGAESKVKLLEKTK